MRSPQTMGELKPMAGVGTFQAMPSPVFGFHAPRALVNAQTPLPSAPRKHGQLRLNSSGEAASAEAGEVSVPNSFASSAGPLGKGVVRPKLITRRKAPMAAPTPVSWTSLDPKPVTWPLAPSSALVNWWVANPRLNCSTPDMRGIVNYE